MSSSPTLYGRMRVLVPSYVRPLTRDGSTVIGRPTHDNGSGTFKVCPHFPRGKWMEVRFVVNAERARSLWERPTVSDGMPVGAGCRCGQDHGWSRPEQSVFRTRRARSRVGSRRHKKMARAHG